MEEIKSQIIIYQSENGKTKLDVHGNENVSGSLKYQGMIAPCGMNCGLYEIWYEYV